MIRVQSNMLPRLSQFELNTAQKGAAVAKKIAGKKVDNDEPAELRLRRPNPADGVAVHDLIADCPPLDPNSIYCNLIQCAHFAETCILAEKAGEIVGFASAYQQPQQPEVLFVWQIAVAASCRGEGLAARMLDELLARPVSQNIRYIETTITPANIASAGLFERLAHKRGAALSRTTLFTRSRHFADRHDDEILLRIGPMTTAVAS